VKRWIAALGLVAAAAVVLLMTSATSYGQTAAPRNFVIGQHCGLDGVTLTFGLPGTDEAAALTGRGDYPDEVWIDISLFNNNFAPRTFLGAGPFGPPAIDDAGYWFTWPGLIDARQHYYRFNALMDGRWMELGRGSFVTIDCFRVTGQSCEDDGEVTVTFELPLNDPVDRLPTVEQWIDIRLGNSFDFPRGGFIGAGPFPPPVASPPLQPFHWRNILPARQHSYRVNQLMTNGQWDTHSRGGFTSLDCRNLVATIAPRI
jgi:hypothetical protein